MSDLAQFATPASPRSHDLFTHYSTEEGFAIVSVFPDVRIIPGRWL